MIDLEKQLQEQPLRQVPAHWREDIIKHVGEIAPKAEPVRPGWRLADLFAPYSKAWGTLAAAWIVILLLNLSTMDNTPMPKITGQPPVMALKQQQLLLAELLGPVDPPPDADHTKPQPRSEIRLETVMV
jgi:hypothetical protein